MGSVVTQIEMMKYSGMEKAVFPEGTILTPSAKDYAAENNIKILIGGNGDTGKSFERPAICMSEKEKLLKQVIKSVIDNSNKSGRRLDTGEISKIATACLERLGCSIEK